MTPRHIDEQVRNRVTIHVDRQQRPIGHGIIIQHQFPCMVAERDYLMKRLGAGRCRIGINLTQVDLVPRRKIADQIASRRRAVGQGANFRDALLISGTPY